MSGLDPLSEIIISPQITFKVLIYTTYFNLIYIIINYFVFFSLLLRVFS